MLRQGRQVVALMVLALGGLPATPGLAGGFAVSGQSASAVALGGALTAEPDDPGALFYNVASGAFQDSAYVLGAVARASWDFTFDSRPEAGIATQFGQQDPDLALPHAYTVQPLRPYLKLGLAVYQPFAHEASWNNVDTFPGRATSYSSTIDTLDVASSVAVRFKSGLGLGVGLIFRTSDVTLSRRLQTTDPLSGELVDFGDFAVDSGQEQAFGFTVGALRRVSDRFSWGFSYRSAIEIDYSGSAVLSQIATGNSDLDDLLALTNPFDQELAATSTIEFPDSASLGIAFGSAEKLRTAIDVNWTGWSSFDQLAIGIAEFPLFSQTISQQFDDTLSFRVGVRWGIASKTELRFGYAFEETPQPDAAVGAFLYDADRNTLAVGIGRDWLDVAVEWTSLSSRSGGTLSGTFAGESILASVSVKP